jgi:hypothetical protein
VAEPLDSAEVPSIGDSLIVSACLFLLGWAVRQWEAGEFLGWVVGIGAPVVVVVGTAVGYRRQAAVRNAGAQVDAAFERLKDGTPGKDVATISNMDVAVSAKEAGVKTDEEHIARLVEQKKQQLLIDDEYFRRELSLLIVDYLQPLPRNAKRVLNRFRVNLLIAHGRGLFTSDPKVTTQEIGKWLVLGERWPQLARALATSPRMMDRLERTSDRKAFGQLVVTLAPFYEGDDELQTFIQSKPQLADVLSRLVHYGTEQSAPRNAQTVP